MTRCSIAALVTTACLTAVSPAGADEIGTCERGLIHLRDGAPARAFLLLDGCTSDEAVAGLAEAERVLSGGEFAPVSVIVEPEGATITVDTLGDEPFVAPRDIWLAPGTHIVRATMEGYEDFTTEVIIRGTDRYPLLLRLRAVGTGPTHGAATSTVDFGNEPGAGVGDSVVSVDPNIEHETLLPKRYRGGGVSNTIDGGEGRLSAGVKAGLTVATLTNAGSADARLGAAVGAFATYSLGSAFALQPELYFAQKGVMNAELSYIVVPALAMVGVKVHAKVRLYAVAGPELGVALTSEVNGQDVTVFDVGLVAGAGVLLPVVGRGIRIEGRYEHGLNAVDGDDARNRAFALTAGYVF